MSEEQCWLDHLRVEVTGTVRIDNEGRPDFDQYLTPNDVDVSEVDPYLCLNCDQVFATFSDAVGHMHKVGEVA